MLNKKNLVCILSISLCSISFINSTFLSQAQELNPSKKTYRAVMSTNADLGWYLDKDGVLTKQIEVVNDKSNIDKGEYVSIPKRAVIRNKSKKTDYNNPVFRSIIVDKGMDVSAIASVGRTATSSISTTGSIGLDGMSNLLGFQVTSTESITTSMAQSFGRTNVPYRGHIEVYPVYEHYDFTVYMRARRGLKNWTPILDGYGKRVVGFEAKFVRDTF